MCSSHGTILGKRPSMHLWPRQQALASNSWCNRAATCMNSQMLHLQTSPIMWATQSHLRSLIQCASKRILTCYTKKLTGITHLQERVEADCRQESRWLKLIRQFFSQSLSRLNHTNRLNLSWLQLEPMKLTRQPKKHLSSMSNADVWDSRSTWHHQ